MIAAMNAAPFEFARENHPLAGATLYDVGGPARLALFPRNAAEARTAHAWMLAQPGPHLVLGNGSNVLVADEGFPGIVLFTSGLDTLDALGGGRYYVGGGVDLGRLVRHVVVANNYHGTGALAGIPGSVGGAIYMNAGTVNGAACEFLESVDLVTPAGLATVAIDPSMYGYREQRFCGRDDLIVAGLFHFTVAQEDQRAIYDHYIQRRKEKQPQGHCCGSVFKNPPNDHAGRLIEACGLKGTRRGGAVISPMHANFIMNEGGASCEDILWLIGLIKRTVHDRFGVELEEEVRIIRPSIAS
ncbi:MAG: UDP-N-acetylenolpyruvoylglucosamine reductase [Candidatus Hydrogenedentes bacterium]|nr:UDP-N-acetylenolpyruvoylglucosamine reductase [Candidatus Hydrogenedentota bacterium]